METLKPDSYNYPMGEKMSIEGMSPRKGEIAFVWFNPYSGVTLKTPTKTLLIDPAEIDPKNFRTVDAILVTHEHSDHCDPYVIKDIHKRTNCPVIADSTSVRKLKDIIPSNKLLEVTIGSEHRIDGIIIRAEPCKHPAATPVTYLITTEDNVKIYHSADSLPHPEMKQIGQRSPPDIAFVTVGTPAPGASPRTGIEIVKMLQPKAAVPYHAPTSELNRFAQLLSQELPKVRCILIEQGKPYKYP